jgi:hypothetical protein
MSALSPLCPQKQTLHRSRGMSAMCQNQTHAPQHPVSSFDQLVGTGEQLRMDFDGKDLGGLEVDNQFLFGRRLHRQIGGLLPPEHAADIAGGAPVLADLPGEPRFRLP